jgi:hypothetical protein
VPSVTCSIYRPNGSKSCLCCCGGNAYRNHLRFKFALKNRKRIEHALSHWKRRVPDFHSKFDWNLPLYDCQVRLILDYKKAVPFSPHTGTKDVFWSIYQAYKDLA